MPLLHQREDAEAQGPQRARVDGEIAITGILLALQGVAQKAGDLGVGDHVPYAELGMLGSLERYQALGGAVDQQDATVRIGDDDAARHGVEHHAEQVVVRGQPAQQLAQLRRVDLVQPVHGPLIKTSHYPHVGPPCRRSRAGRGAQRAAQPLQRVARLNAQGGHSCNALVHLPCPGLQQRRRPALAATGSAIPRTVVPGRPAAAHAPGARAGRRRERSRRGGPATQACPSGGGSVTAARNRVAWALRCSAPNSCQVRK